jgi:hypothetical protein
MLRGIAVATKLQEEMNQEWEDRLNRMTLDEKRVELGKTPDFSFYASGLNAVMLVGVLPMFTFRVFTGSGYNPWIIAWSSLMVFLAGAGPITGLHWGTHARLAKKYGVFMRTAEHRALDILFGVIVILALGTHFSYLNPLPINLILLAGGILAQIVLFRWVFLGTGPVNPPSTALSKSA